MTPDPPTPPPEQRVYVGFPDDYDEMTPEQEYEVCDQIAAAIQEGLRKGREGGDSDRS